MWWLLIEISRGSLKLRVLPQKYQRAGILDWSDLQFDPNVAGEMNLRHYK